jgi:hypothetical protein
MTTTNHVARANIAILQQGIDLLTGATDELYVRTMPPAFPNGTGPHVRHCLDHVANFLDGLAEGRIDYDRRAREKEVETRRSVAIERMRDMIGRLAAIGDDDADRPVVVKMDEGGEETEPANWSRSTVKRELQFLLSHTIHHYALIAAELRSAGFEPGPDFGVAPSTLRYQKTL